MTLPSERAAGRSSSTGNDEKRTSNPRATWNKLTSSLSEKRRKAVLSEHGVQEEEFDPQDQAHDVNVAENGGNRAIFSDAELERLGRERPACFPNIWHEIAFSFSLVMSQVLAEYFISGFNVIVPTLVEEFDIPAASAVWPASAFSLVVASTLLFFGRLSDMIGGYPVYVGGMAWLLVWSLIAGFSQNRLMLIFCRALQGLGPAAYLPSGMMLLASTYRPGPRKNIIFSIYGTCAVIGFFLGIFMSGVSAEFITWQWYFWIGAILTAITTASSYFFIPPDTDQRRKQDVKMDYWGTGLILPGLVLTVYAITDSAHAPEGWKSPQILVCLILGCLFIGAAVYVEGWVAEYPLLPFDVFNVPYMKAMVISLFFFYGCLGIFMLYGTLYMTHIMGASPIQIVIWCLPMVVGGFIFPLLAGVFLHLVSGTVLLVISGVGWLATPLLFALMPEGSSYWAFVFPAMIGATMGIDLTFNITNIFITTNQSANRQGLAGAIINSVLHLSISVLLGFADLAQVSMAHLGQLESYRATFWFQTACAAVSLLLMVLFVRVNAAKSELTPDERRQLELETSSAAAQS